MTYQDVGKGLKAFWDRALSHPRTTGLGIGGLLTMLAACVADWRLVLKTETWAVIFVSLGLIVGADAKEKPNA